MRMVSRDWDSAFFGYPVAAAEPDHEVASASEVVAALEEARGRGIRLLYVFLPPVDEALRSALRQEGIRAVGRKVEYAKDVPAASAAGADPEIISCRAGSPALERLAFQSGQYSRFRLDDGFRRQEFERLYREWLAGSLAGQDGKCVFVAGEETHPIGMITLEPGAAMRIGLFAVDPAHHRRGIGRRLMDRAEQFCVQRRARELRVATQAENRQACLFYESRGFAKAGETDVFHAWLPDGPAEQTQERRSRP